MASSRFGSFTLVLSLLAVTSVVPLRAHAHPVTVDGASAEWSTRLPNGPNLGIVARDAMSRGELVWFDARLDARTDLPSPDPDFTRFAVTADATNVYFLLEIPPGGSMLVSPPQIQIAIDTDRVVGSGEANFAGFADTTVAADAEWEFLVQTLGLSSARVRDTSFTVVGPAAFATIGGIVEIAVPWATLEGAGRTLDVLRFTVAVFAENAASAGGDTVDLPGTSNALDVMTDYADPTTTTFPNTFVEVMDGDVDYSVDVWFERTRGREPYAPLSVNRFMSNAPTGTTEWIELRNQTPVSLDLSTFCVGDEETPVTGESMQCFPADALASGGVVTIALSGVEFLAQYGVVPDYDEGLIGDLTPHPTWTGTPDFGLNNTNDEVLVLGWHNTIVDLANYGPAGTAYPGVTPRAAPGASLIATRTPVTQDTDDTAVDFPDALEDCGPLAGLCTATCRTCQRFACVADTGAACDDGDACTMGSTCTAAAVCSGGSATVCPEDGNACTTASCNPATGCGFTNNTASCDDGDGCTTGDVCAGGTCGGSPRTCADTNPCTADACVAGACVFTPTPAVPCDDGSMCTTLDLCSLAGTCAGTPVVCLEDGNPCTTASCSPASGCGFTNNTAACTDGDLCTEGDVCGGGVCTGTPRTCTDSNTCTTDSCALGLCVFTPTTGSTCNDGNACTSGDVCTAGVCAGTGECDAGVDAGTDSGVDSGTPDTGVDAGEPDTGVDAGEPDTGVDAGEDDAGVDAGELDAGELDTGELVDVGLLDVGPIDVGPIDAGPMDAGDAGDAGDGGGGDVGPTDAGPFDGGPAEVGTTTGGITGGACNCHVGGRSSPTWMVVALGLTLALIRRRR